jgi:hypothetical protein
VSITINDSVWRDKIALYAAAFQKNMVEALNEEWPLLMEQVIRFTPPKTLAQGRAATNRDIRKTMRPFDPAAPRDSGLREVIEKKDIEGYNAIAANVKSGPMAGTTAVAFAPEVHTRRRNRIGRVGSDSRQVVLGSDARLLARYIKDVQNRVGFAKSGWLAALRLVGGRRAQAFVERQGTFGGRVVDDRRNPDNPSITAINATPWAARRDEGNRIINSAMFSRSMAIVSKIKTKLRLASKSAGFRKAA